MLVKKMYGKNHLFISDIHFFHKNILAYEPKRLAFFTDKPLEFFQNIDEIHSQEAINAEIKAIDERMMEWIWKAFDEQNAKTPIDVLCIGGDFFFNFNKHKFENWDYEFEKIEKFIQKFPCKKVLVLGNHDDGKYFEWYEKCFDEITTHFYEIDSEKKELTLVTHYPFGDFQRTDKKSRGQIDKQLKKVDLELFEDLYEKYLKSDYTITNIHGHTHSEDPAQPLEGVEYVNMSIENFLE